MYPRSLISRSSTLIIGGLCAGALLTGCSSADGPTPVAWTPVSTSAAASDAADLPGTDAMRALCEQMVADKLSPEDATSLAEENGFVARVGTIDGVPQAVTRDFREDRFTLEVTAGVVSGCTFG